MSSKSRRRRGSIDLGQLERDNTAEIQHPNPQPLQQKQRSERKRTSRRSRKKSDEISKSNNNSDKQEKRDAKAPDEDDEKRDDDETSQLGDLPERPPSRCKQRAKSPYRKRGQSLRLSGGIPRELVLGGEPDASPGERGSGGRSRSRSKSSRQKRRNSSGGLGSSSDPATNFWPQHTLPPPPPPPEDNWEASFSSISTRSVGWTATTVSSSSSSLSETSEKKRQCNKPNVQPQRRGSMNDSLMSNTPKSKESTTTSGAANSNGKKPPQARRLSLPPSAPSAPPRSDPSHTPRVTNRKKMETMDKPPTQRRPEPSPTKQDKKELKQDAPEKKQQQTSPRESRGSTTTPASPPSRSRSKTPSSQSGSKRSVRSKTPNKQRKSLREALEAKRAAAASLKSCLKSATSTTPRRAGLSVCWDTRRSVTGEYFHSASSTASKDFLEHPDDDIRIWWSEKEIEHRWDRNLQIAFVFSEPYKELLIKAFACCRKEVDRATNEKKRPRLSAVDVCFSTLEQLSPARGLEAEICSAICERQAAHSRAVVDAQVFMWDEQASPATIERMLRHQSLKRSRLSSLFAQKMAEFDSQAAQDLIDIKTPARSPSFDA